MFLRDFVDLGREAVVVWEGSGLRGFFGWSGFLRLWFVFISFVC